MGRRCNIWRNGAFSAWLGGDRGQRHVDAFVEVAVEGRVFRKGDELSGGELGGRYVKDSNLRIRDSRLLEALNPLQKMEYGTHHHGYPVWLGCCVTPISPPA